MKLTMRVAVLGAVMAAGSVMAAEEGAPEFPKFTAGGSFRLRQEAFDHVPIKVDPPGETRGGLNNYIRFRTQVWGQYDIDQHVSVYTRLANEFRHYYDPDNTSWDFPDELVVDNAYLDMHNLLADESLTIRIGRQDLAYPGFILGTGRLILEGTPKDGSRTIYFDAARFTWKKDDLTLHLIGIYNQSDAELLINDQHRDITGYSSAYNDLDESGVVLYGTYQVSKQMIFESYYIYKHESEWENGPATIPELDVHTVGARVANKYSDLLSSNLEIAGQLNERDGMGDVESVDGSGYMVDAAIKADFMRDSSYKPWSKLGVTLYSGNDPDSSDDEGWNPLWGRYPQIGIADLMSYAYDADGAAKWSNLAFFYGHCGMNVNAKVTLAAMLGQIEATEADGPGGGYTRGLYAATQVGMALGKPGITANDSVKSHVVAEMLEPGDYYKSSTETAYFLRWEVTYTF